MYYIVIVLYIYIYYIMYYYIYIYVYRYRCFRGAHRPGRLPGRSPRHRGRAADPFGKARMLWEFPENWGYLILESL